MFMLLVLLVAAVIQSTFVVNDDLVELAKHRMLVNQRADVVDVSKAVIQFYDEFNVYPASLATLASTSGYEFVQSIVLRQPRLNYVITDLVGTDYRYQRFIVFVQNHFDTRSVAEYLEFNECGVTSFSNAADFCPEKSSHFYIRTNQVDIVAARQRAVYLLDQTFARLVMWGGNSSFGSTLSAGDSNTLSSLAGYGGSAASCFGQYSFDGAELSCIDLFNEFGLPVTFNKISDSHFALVSRLPYRNAANDFLYVVRDIQL